MFFSKPYHQTSELFSIQTEKAVQQIIFDNFFAIPSSGNHGDQDNKIDHQEDKAVDD